MKILFLLLVLSGAFSCQRPEDEVLKNSDGVVTRLPHIWKSSTSNDGGMVSSMFAQHIYDNSYVLAAQRPETRASNVEVNLCFKRIEDGQTAWVWNDPSEIAESNDVRNYKVYFYNNLFLYKHSFRFYCIDQETGKTLWKKQWGRNFDSQITTTRLGSHFYFTGTPPEIYAKNRWEESIY